MPHMRFAVLLPARGQAQRACARRCISAFRSRFPGGTWISAPNEQTVVNGWWSGWDGASLGNDVGPAVSGNARRVDRSLDEHILVYVDFDTATDSLSIDGVADLISAVFRWHYNDEGVEQFVISIIAHQISDLSRPGRWMDIIETPGSG